MIAEALGITDILDAALFTVIATVPSIEEYSELLGVNLHAADVVPISGTLSGSTHARVPSTVLEFSSSDTNTAALN